MLPAPRLKAITLYISVLLIAGCSPHPGSGIWKAASENEPGFVKIEVHYDGRADIYNATDETAVRRCFWGGMSPQQLALDCVLAADTDIQENYRLSVTHSGTAELTRNQQLIGTFSKQPRSE